MKFKKYNKKINKNTKGRYNSTPIFQDYKLFTNLITNMPKPFTKSRMDKVVGLDALGFIVVQQLH